MVMTPSQGDVSGYGYTPATGTRHVDHLATDELHNITIHYLTYCSMPTTMDSASHVPFQPSKAEKKLVRIWQRRSLHDFYIYSKDFYRFPKVLVNFYRFRKKIPQISMGFHRFLQISIGRVLKKSADHQRPSYQPAGSLGSTPPVLWIIEALQ